MSVQTINSNIKPGCCPHGLPSGACPVCSGMSGSGSKVTESAGRKKDEWSYEKCYAVWQQMLAKKAQKANSEKTLKTYNFTVLNFQKNIREIIVKADSLINTLQSKLPKPIAKTLQIISQKILIPVLKMLEKLPGEVKQVMDGIQRILVDISDKLVAIFGELKKNIEERLQKSLKLLKKKVLLLFGVFSVETDEEQDDNKIKEEKKILRLRFMKDYLLKMIAVKEENMENKENAEYTSVS